MEIKGKSGEYFLLKTVIDNKTILDQNKNNSLSIYWNKVKNIRLTIDSISYIIEPNQILFLTEYHHVEMLEDESINIIRFNRNFYCLDNHDEKIGCKGILFFGTAQVPIINLTPKDSAKFELLWKVFLSEVETVDDLQLEMLQMLLKRFLIISTRIYKNENKILLLKETKIDIIRNFCSLVEIHYKTKHTVAQYAELINRPSKSLANLFTSHINKTPLQIIHDRILIESKRLILYSNKNIKETAIELGFEDLQTFSRFFKNKEGLSPKEFRKKNSK